MVTTALVLVGLAAVIQLIVGEGEPRYTTPATKWCAMDSKTDFGSIVVAICVAAYTAIMLAYLAQHNLGLTATQTRHLSMLAALFLALPIALDLLRAGADNAR